MYCAARKFLRYQLRGYQDYGPFLGTLNIRCRIMIGIQKGTIILTTTHLSSLTWNRAKQEEGRADMQQMCVKASSSKALKP